MAVSYDAGDISKAGRLRSVIVVTPNVTETQYNTSNLVFNSTLTNDSIAALVGGLAPFTEGFTYEDKSLVVRVTETQDFERIDE